jgi:hypothetical protein
MHRAAVVATGKATSGALLAFVQRGRRPFPNTPLGEEAENSKPDTHR